MKGIAMLHGILKEMICNKEPKFTSKFWKNPFKGFGMNLNLSTTYHPQIGEQIESMDQFIEDMVTMCVIDRPSK